MTLSSPCLHSWATKFDSCRRAGVTLIEALLVIMVLTASMVAAPSVGHLFSSRTSVRQDSDLIVRSLRLARETALSRTCTVTVRWKRVKNNDGEYGTLIDMQGEPGVYSDGGDAFGAQASPGSSTWMVDPIALHPDVNIKTNATSIQFTSDGTASRDLQMVVSRDTESVEVFVQASSGNIYKDATL